MKYTYARIVDSEKRKAVMRLYGSIGGKIDGDLFARELAYLDDYCDSIELWINSNGGEVVQGMSIVSAIISMRTPVDVYVGGVAASMAAVIAQSGDNLYMMDFAQYMVHDPAFAGDNSNLSPKQKKQLRHMKNMLQRVLARRGKSEEEISKLMTAETWFTAEEAKAAGLCDGIISSSRTDMTGLTPQQIIAQIDSEYQLNDDNMEKLTNETCELLGVKAEASASEVAAAAVAKVKAADKRAADAEADLKKIRDAQAETDKVEAKALVAAATKDGRINADDKDAVAAWESMFETDYAKAKAALSAIPKHQPVAGQVGKKTDAAEKYTAMSWDELDRGNHLEKVKADFPDLYAEKFEAQFGRKPKQ